MPLRSDDAEAAVGGALATVVVLVSLMCTSESGICKARAQTFAWSKQVISRGKNGCGYNTRQTIETNAADLGHLRVQALPHLCATVGEQHRAVGVHVDECRGLIHEGCREGDAKLCWHQGQAALGPAVRRVEGRHLHLALGEPRRGLECRPHALQLRPASAWATQNKSNCYYKSGRRSEEGLSAGI
jgi:hypothetical protein